MFVSRETDYALRTLRELSCDTPTSVKNIAERECITVPIAYKVALKLEKGGLVKSVRGAKGGYILAKPADRFTILDVYRIMEPDSLIAKCLHHSYDCPMNDDKNSCAVQKELARIQDVLFAEMQRYSMADVLNGGTDR